TNDKNLKTWHDWSHFTRFNGETYPLKRYASKQRNLDTTDWNWDCPITSMCGKRTRHITRESWHCWENMDCSCAPSPPTWWGRRSATGLTGDTKPSCRHMSGGMVTPKG